MGGFVNPVFAYGMVPGVMNPTGNQISNFASPSTSRSGLNAMIPNVNLSTSSSGRTSSFDIVPATSPSFPANTGGGFTSSGSNLFTGTGTSPSGSPLGISGVSPHEWDKLLNSLSKTYGEGFAHLILSFLQGGAGFNQQAINNLLASLQPGIERGKEDIMEQFSVMGNRFGSPAAIGLGDFLSRVNLQEGELITQMYEDSLNRFMDVMMGVSGPNAQRIASSPGFLDQLNTILGMTGGGLSAAGATLGI